MSDLERFLSGPVLTLEFLVMGIVASPWLLIPVTLPWLLASAPALSRARASGGLKALFKQSHGRVLLVVGAASILIANLTPLVAEVLADFKGKDDFEPNWILFHLSVGSCLSSMMVLTVLMSLFVGFAHISQRVRMVSVFCCCLSATLVDIYGMYEIAGSTDGQAALAYPITPIAAHMIASVVASLFSMWALWRWWKTRGQAVV